LPGLTSCGRHTCGEEKVEGAALDAAVGENHRGSIFRLVMAPQSWRDMDTSARLDSSHVKAHRPAAGGKEGETSDRALAGRAGQAKSNVWRMNVWQMIEADRPRLC
jgi:hypothetical protein